jgi:hypothetical protein
MRSRPRARGTARPQRQALREATAEQHDRHVRQQHARGGADHDFPQRRILRREHDGGDLRLVANLGEEEGDGRGDEGIARGQGLVVVDLVGLQGPQPDREETDRHDPTQHVGREPLRDERAEPTGERMVEQGGHQDACHDGNGLAETRGEQQREQLRLVADLGDGDGEGGDQEGLHRGGLRGPGILIARAPWPVGQVCWRTVRWPVRRRGGLLPGGKWRAL